MFDLTWDDFVAHSVAASVPLLLFVTYWLFRRVYVRGIRSAIYSPMAASPDVAPSTIATWPPRLALRWVDAQTWTDRHEPEAVAAGREDAAARMAYASSGALLVALGFAIVFTGLRQSGFGWRGAIVVAALNTFVGVALILMFARATWRVAAMTVVIWVVSYFGLTVGVVKASWTAAATVLASNIPVTMSLPSLMILPFALRAMRPLVVAFIPFFALLATLAALMTLVFEVLNLPLTGQPTVRAVVAGTLAAGLGVATVVRQIRRGIRPGLVAIWLIGLATAALVAWGTGHFLAAVALGIFTHGLFVLVAWGLLRALLSLKARGYAPSETLHYAGCSGIYMISLAFAGQLSWGLLSLLIAAFVAYVGFLYWLLRRHHRPIHAPRRMLFLRVFQHAPIRSRLIDLLDDTWRRIGRIDTVVGLDLALHTLNALAFEDFLRGRIRRQFVKDPAEVQERVTSLSSTLAVDRRYPLNELHCLPDTWQPVVRALLLDADVVLIDVRGLHAANRGALFELELAMRLVPLQRLVLLADSRTDKSIVESSAQGSFHAPGNDPSSPTAHDVLVVNRFSDVSARGIVNAIFAAAR